MTPGLKKWILRPLLIFLISSAAILGICILLLITQQERLVNLAVQHLDTHFKGELTVEESSLSLFKHFPNVGIAFHGVRFFSDKTETGKPLTEFDRMYIGFSLPDLFRRRYTVTRLSMHGGSINLVRETNGKFNILEALDIEHDSIPHPEEHDSDFEMNLRKIVLKELEISLLDRASGRKISTRIDNLSSEFTTVNNDVNIGFISTFGLNITSPYDTVLFRNKRCQMGIEAVYKTDSKLFAILEGGLRLQEAAFKVDGTATFAEPSKVDFRIRGEEPDFSHMTAFFPGDVKQMLKPFKYDGRIYFDSRVHGNISGKEFPLVEVSFGCEDAWFMNTGAGKKVDQLGFKGYFTNGNDHSLKTSELHITNIRARPEKGIFSGSFIIRDFTNPHAQVQINSELELKFLGEFLGIPDLKQTTGKIKLEMDFKEVVNLDVPEESLYKLKEGTQSKLSVEGLSFRIPGYPHTIRDMNLWAKMKDSKVTLDSGSLRIGNSDLRFAGTISDIHAFLRNRKKMVTLTLNASGRKLVLGELYAYDTALSNRMDEEILGFHMGLTLETTVQQLLYPAPLPKGLFEVTNCQASFKNYPHKLKNFGASITVNDTLVRMRNLTGMVDSTDIQLSGSVVNYPLWFEKLKKGRTQIAFDFKSKRFAMRDLLTPGSRHFVPRGYRREEANDVWLQAKIDMRYDTVFRFARAAISNITGVLKRHAFSVKNIHGMVKYGASRILIVDSLKGTIGRSDIDVKMRLFAGKDKKIRKKTNFFQFSSKFLDVDEISNYNLAPVTGPRRRDSTAVVQVDTSSHTKSFNIFMIPFSDFKARIDVGKIKYNKIWMKDFHLRLRMTEDHYLYLDTLDMKVAGGEVSINGHLNGSNPEKIYLTSTINLEQVDLEKMMLKLDHFGQDVAINKNIKGRLTGQIKSEVQVHPNLVPIVNEAKAEMNFKIYNGSLVDFAPMQAMAGYFRDKNLRLIRFDTLHNELTFSKGVLNIPSMNINSSLGYIQVSGKQSLDLDMEYYIRVPMKMVTQVAFNSLFAGKPEEVNIAQIDEIDYSGKGKKGRFMNLKVTGKPEDFNVGLGRDKRRN